MGRPWRDLKPHSREPTCECGEARYFLTRKVRQQSEQTLLENGSPLLRRGNLHFVKRASHLLSGETSRMLRTGCSSQMPHFHPESFGYDLTSSLSFLCLKAGETICLPASVVRTSRHLGGKQSLKHRSLLGGHAAVVRVSEVYKVLRAKSFVGQWPALHRDRRLTLTIFTGSLSII